MASGLVVAVTSGGAARAWAGVAVAAAGALLWLAGQAHFTTRHGFHASFLVLSRFCDIDLHPEAVPNLEMGYLYEELVRRFSELSNETAGEHFTPREVIRLMVDLLFIEDDDLLAKPGIKPVRPGVRHRGDALRGRRASSQPQPRRPT